MTIVQHTFTHKQYQILKVCLYKEALSKARLTMIYTRINIKCPYVWQLSPRMSIVIIKRKMSEK